MPPPEMYRKQSFNTSHVTLYQEKAAKHSARSWVSIHHMLLFITVNRPKGLKSPAFQYITCYSLSCFRQLLSGQPCRFNTSHVTLYHMKDIFEKVSEKFQYITCYSLSLPIHTHYCHSSFQYITCYSLSTADVAYFAEGWKFQYITCYSLSMKFHLLMLTIGCFNTSHVTLYPLSNGKMKNPGVCFNTSHVTLYPLPATI